MLQIQLVNNVESIREVEGRGVPNGSKANKTKGKGIRVLRSVCFSGGFSARLISFAIHGASESVFFNAFVSLQGARE